MNTLCGIDEAGRGCLAGPLVVAGVVLRGDIAGLMDSKILSPKKREALFDVILKEALHHHIVIITPEEIDHTGISGAMRRALTEIREAVSAATYLFDGNTPFGVERITCQVKADRDIPAVSAASILAKVTKDRELLRLGADYPHYGFETHPGYGTKAHIEAIKRYGLSPLHRKSFQVKSLVQPSLF